MKANIYLLLFLFLCNKIVGQSCHTLRYQDTVFHSFLVTSGIQYATASPYGALAQPQSLYLDIYEPANDTLSKRPVIVFQFGGGFLIGFRTQPPIPKFCEYFAKCGYVVVAIDYRIGFNTVSTGSAERAVVRSVQDQRAAIRHLAQRCNQYRIDTNSIFLTGTSAGCFAGLHSTFMTEAQVPASYHGIPLEPDDLGCMDCSGNSDYGNRYLKPRGIVNQWGAILDTSFIDPWDSVPVLSIHGTSDNAVPYEKGYPFSYPVFPVVYGSHPITERMNHLGLQTQLVSLVGFGHEPELLNPELNDTINHYSREFLWNIIRPRTSLITGKQTICKGEPVTYSVNDTPGSKYCWTLSGNGSIVSSNGNSINVVWTDTGLVSVSVQELNYLAAEGEERSYTTQVVPHAYSNFSYVTNELDVSFINESTDAAIYNWTFGDGSDSAIFNPGTKSYTTAGNYQVILIADNLVCSDTVAKSFSVDSCPVADITLQLNNFNAFLNTPATNTVAYYWNFGDGDSAAVNFPNVFHQYTQPGNYIATVRVVNQLGCVEADTLSFSVGLSSIENLSAHISVSQNGDWLIVQADALKCYLDILDVSGRKIESYTLTSATEISLAEYEAGVYLVRVSDGQRVFIQKVFKY